MKKHENIRGALAVATCSLLGLPVASGAAEGDWQVDTALLYYGEQDRVEAVEPVVSATRDLGDDASLNLKLVLDGLSGASANGAQVEDYAQTFTSPSGEHTYTVPAGAVPLQTDFSDTRAAFSAAWTTPLANPLWKRTLGANVSREDDFFSLGLTGAIARDLNKRNTTLTAGLSLEMDTIDPHSGTPRPFSEMDSALDEDAPDGSGDRTVTDLLLGVTQVIDRRTVMQFNYNLNLASGYMNDPYKMIAIADDPGVYVFENRPDSRTRHALFWQTKHAFGGGDVLDASYRFLTDDWGIVSHTIDAHYRVGLPGDWYVEPHLRWYEQGAADFYTARLDSADRPASGDDSVAYSADYRLGDLTTTTVGARFGKRLSETGEAWMRLEGMEQTGDTAQGDLSAIIVEFGYSFLW